MGRALRLTTVLTDMRAMVEMATGFRLAGMQAPGKWFGWTDWEAVRRYWR